MSTKWYAIRSKPNNEDFLFNQLLERKVETFYPKICVQPVNPRSRHFQPYFPRYLFVKLDLDHIAISNLLWIPGASYLVCFGGEPATIPAELITIIQKKVNIINLAGGDQVETIKEGDKVIINEGPFLGYEGVFENRLSGRERVRVLLKLLHNHHFYLEIPETQMQLVK